MAHPLEDLQIGQRVEQEFLVSADMVEAFIRLTGDAAPVHLQQDHAERLGFNGPIAHGLLVASLYSSLLGMRLPGPDSVIMKLSTDMLKPVYPGDRLLLSAAVGRISAAAKAVTLGLAAVRGDVTVNRGSATCLIRG